MPPMTEPIRNNPNNNQIAGQPADQKSGKTYWRSLDELAETPEFHEFLHREFPQGASELADGMDRRQFLTLMSASLALAGLASGCRRPVEHVLPHSKVSELTLAGEA